MRDDSEIVMGVIALIFVIVLMYVKIVEINDLRKTQDKPHLEMTEDVQYHSEGG